MGVSTLSTFAMILYPAMTSLLGFSDHVAGVFIGARSMMSPRWSARAMPFRPKLGTPARWSS